MIEMRVKRFVMYLQMKQPNKYKDEEQALEVISCSFTSCHYGRDGVKFENYNSIFWCREAKQYHHYTKKLKESKKKKRAHYILCRQHFNQLCVKQKIPS